MTPGRVEMELRDGRVIDLTGLTAEAAIARLRQLAITPADVKQTTHFISLVKDRP